MRRVTFSRNFTISQSRTCRGFCKYCSFAAHQPHRYTPDAAVSRGPRAPWPWAPAAHALQDAPVALLARHGVVACGRTLDEVVELCAPAEHQGRLLWLMRIDAGCQKTLPTLQRASWDNNRKGVRFDDREP
jgi:hypothetical protein